MAPSELPDVGGVLAPVLERVAAEQRPLLIALAERMAADRYRGWAEEPVYAAHREDLLACARREDEIASRIEALHPEAAAIQQAIAAGSPDLAEINRALFAGRPLADQLTIQARGERLGAATWRAFAGGADAAARETFETCARLEEQSAAVLEAILEPG